jgi:hypothetical protein
MPSDSSPESRFKLTMNIDVHAHYVPTGSLEMAARIGARHGLEVHMADGGHTVVLRDGKPFLNQAKAEFSNLDLRLSIMQEPLRAAAELERVVSRLGFRGAEIASNINGRYFDDPALEPFWQAAQALDAVIFIHPNQVVGAERMKD